MGLLKTLFSGGLAFNRVAKTLKEILDNLSVYSMYGNIDYLYKAAWLVKYGVCDSIEKWHWSPFAKIFIPDYQVFGRITLNEAIIIVSGKIASAMKFLPKEQSDYVNEIIEGGNAYKEVEYLISIELKNKLMP